MNVSHKLTDLIGHTPLFEITSYPLPNDVRLFAKLEYMNIGGSVKDRLGFYMVDHALKTGELKTGGTVIEATAGNTGIGLALAAIHYDLQAVFVTPKKFSIEKQSLMRALGAKVVQTPTEEGMQGAIKKAETLAQTTDNSYIPDQFNNARNPETYYHTLGPEIWQDLQGHIDVFIAGAGSGGTFTGTSDFLKERNPTIQTVIVEPEGSILNGGEPKAHRTEGIGMERLPDFMDTTQLDRIYTITDDSTFARVREVARQEGLLIGSSSGAVLDAAIKEAARAKQGAHIVTVFPDSSERYISTGIYEEVT